MSGLRRSYGDGPVWIRVAKDEALLLLGTSRSAGRWKARPTRSLSDPEPKKSGMCHFQPDALTISRNPEWEERRGSPRRCSTRAPSSCPNGSSAVGAGGGCDAAGAARLGRMEPRRAPRHSPDHPRRPRRRRRAAVRVARRADGQIEPARAVVDESAVQELPGRALQSYVKAAEAGSLASLFAQAPAGAHTDPTGQVTHWLFALGDTLAINALRCLALACSVRRRAR